MQPEGTAILFEEVVVMPELSVLLDDNCDAELISLELTSVGEAITPIQSNLSL